MAARERAPERLEDAGDEAGQFQSLSTYTSGSLAPPAVLHTIRVSRSHTLCGLLPPAVCFRQQAVVDYGADFLAQFAAVELEEKHGAMITTCICHGCPWETLALDGLNSYQHYAAWRLGNTTGKFFSIWRRFVSWQTCIGRSFMWQFKLRTARRTAGKDSLHIDTRGPNGDGTITDPKCSAFL